MNIISVPLRHFFFKDSSLATSESFGVCVMSHLPPNPVQSNVPIEG